MKRNRVQRKGAAMLWAIMVMIIMALVAAGIIFVARAYYMREREENYRVQAQLFAESAIELVAKDIVTEQGASKFVVPGNATRTHNVSFPDAAGWHIVVTVNHSVVDMSDAATASTTGVIYITARVSRETGGTGDDIELAEVCYRMDSTGSAWTAGSYYVL